MTATSNTSSASTSAQSQRPLGDVCVDFDGGSSGGHRLNIWIPDDTFKKLRGPGEALWKTLLAPGTALLAAAATICAAYLALRGVFRQVKATLLEIENNQLDDRLDDVWERFTWVVDAQRSQSLDWNQRKTILDQLKNKSDALKDEPLSVIIDQWLKGRVQAISAELINSNDTTDVGRILSIGSPDDALEAAILVRENASVGEAVEKNVAAILDRSKGLKQVRDRLAAKQEPQPFEGVAQSGPGAQGGGGTQSQADPLGEILKRSGADDELAYYS